MRRFFSVFITGVFITSLFSSCLSIRHRTADENYERYAYAEAIKDYEWVLRKKKVDEAIVRIADCYRQTGNASKTEYWYRKAIKLAGSPVNHKLFLAEALMRNGKYDEAGQYFAEYVSLNKSDFKAARMMAACDSIQKFYRDTSLFSLQLLKFNTQGENNFSPAYYQSGIVFLSDKNFKGLSNSKSDFTGKRYLDLFYVRSTDKGNWMDPEPLKGDVNGRFNEGPATFTKDFKTMYFTRNNYLSNKVEKNRKNLNVLKIYKASFASSEWKIDGSLYFNSDEYSVCHPALNSDGSVLFFSSDMPWGYGGMDIYMVKWAGGNTWGNPVNLGPKVNSDGNEVFPFLQNDSTLFYSSDGLAGLGGLDVFISRSGNGEWAAAENLLAPINSSHDDFGFITDSAYTKGFLSSNRYAGVDKIFSFIKNQPKLSATLTLVTPGNSGTSNSPSEIEIYIDGKRDTSVSVMGLGRTTFSVAPNRNYEFVVDNKDYYLQKAALTTVGRSMSENILVEIVLNPVTLNKSLIWKGIDFNKKDWQMKLNSGEALDRLATMLKDNPRLQVEIASYTDARGTDSENIKLTQRRAELVLQFLTAQGISAERMIAKGYGEAKLLNKCVNGLLCIEEEHQINNRIEITVKSILKQTATR